MHIEDLTLCTCEEGHNFYIPNDESVDLTDVSCPMCGEEVATEANRTVLVATTGNDTLELLEKYGK